MRTFIIRSLLFFLTATAITVGVFLFVTVYMKSDGAVKETVIDSADEVTKGAQEKTEAVSEKIKEQIPDGGVPLSSLPLTESHKKALRAVDIDVETFVLTEAMITCAGGKIGDERIVEIIEGSAPSVFEITKLIPCLGA
ncbi:MAG: hypothetical protein KBC62_02045 [Candidatus Pacebacteria bacterium]|nr:hypothetical protein [Candidatus Paceibacterota bacterium]MBP9842764.1 hypothetical protein [Candidatus Paceibacterota bacterium]